VQPHDSPILQHAILLEDAERIARLGSFEWHVGTCELHWTPGLWRIYGMEPREKGPTTEQCLSWIHPDDFDEQRRLMADVFRNPRSWETACRIVKAYGEVAHIRVRCVTVGSGDRLVMRGTVQDVTQERRVEEALRRGELRFRALTKDAPVGILELDRQGRCVFVNERFAELTGLSPQQAANTGWMQAIHPEDVDSVISEWKAAVRARSELVRHVRLLRPDGRVVWVSGRSVRVRDDATGLDTFIVTISDVTELKEANRALEEAEARFGNAFEEAPIGMALVSPDGDFLRVNRELARIAGYDADELLALSFQDITHPDDVHADIALLRRVLAGEIEKYRIEKRYIRSDGEILWVMLGVSLVRDEQGEPLYFVSQVEDVSERRRADEAVREAEARFRSAFDSAPIGMVITGLDGRFQRVNAALCKITGYSSDQLEGITFRSITPPEEVPQNDAGLQRLVKGELSVYRAEKRYIHADGHLVPIEISATVVRDADGEPLNFLTQIQDITERKRFEGQLQYLADHDSLTGLFNRRRFEEELARELAVAERYSTHCSVLAIDLDNFKYINDSLGHSTGDELISRVGEALRSRLRRTDVLARLGGDEFAVILPRADQVDAARTAEALLEAVASVDLQSLSGRGGRVTASIGISVYESGSTLTAEELLVEADIAMYDAKEAGRGRATLYDRAEDREERMQARITWADRIREALANDRFVLHAQEIRSLCGDSVPRYELLVRMLSEDGDLIPPGSFLYVAERFDLVQEIDCWVLGKAVQLLADQQAAGRELILSVNLSAKSITDPEVPGTIAALLEEHGADGRGLCLEVTETAAIVNVDRAKQFAQAVAELGCELSLDDFGAGFASFYYLKHLTFDVLKIDGEFVRDLTTSATNQLVVKSVVDIAGGLGKRTVAEFVGDQETLELLRGMGVDFAQGFHIGKPQPLDVLGLRSHIEMRSSERKPARS
jgi:diguanylate cyclase (GGDEF)-like protein/PAS domain S-box-containing protein